MNNFLSDIKRNAKFLIPMLIVCVLILFIPMLTDNNYIITVMISFFTFSALGITWNIIGGYAAQISWGHASFVAIGAYTSYLMYLRLGITPFISLIPGMGISVLFAMLVGGASFRLRGTFFTLSTIAFSEIVRVLLLYFKDFSGGANGLYLAYKGANLLNLQFENDKPHFYILFLMLLIIIYLTRRLQNSRMGYYLKAIKNNEDAAQSLGIDTHKVKLKAFLISAALTSAVGSIYGFFLAYIDPTALAGLDLSVKIGVVAIVGGIATIWGPIIGSLMVVALTEVTNAFLGQRVGASYMIYGIVLVLVVLFRPNGLISLFNRNHEKISLKQRIKRIGKVK